MSNLQSGASEAQMIELFNSIKFPIMGAGGGFAPIGTENYFEGTTAPVGWVICDGSVLNISDYPELATYYASHYGASNHFGGDGVTTFAVPTKEGMPENTDSVYGEQERIVGVWKETVDGVLKQKPLYCKTINCGALPNNSTKELDTGVSDLEYIYYCNGECVDKVQGTSNPIPYVHVSALSWQIQIYFFGSSKKLQLVTKENWGNDYIAYVTIQYTKTTDSWTLPTPGHSADGNGVFCVKATLSDANLDAYTVYSPNEHQVGWWQEEVDGVLKQKPVYEKTIHIDSASIGSWTQYDIDTTNILDNDNIDVKYLFGGYYVDITNTKQYFAFENKMFGTMASDSYGYQIVYRQAAKKICINGTWGGLNYTINDVNIYIRYTKTTDEWQVV